jgi:hypothetical protein
MTDQSCDFTNSQNAKSGTQETPDRIPQGHFWAWPPHWSLAAHWKSGYSSSYRQVPSRVFTLFLMYTPFT